MPKAQSPEFRRSERGANDSASAKPRLDASSAPAASGEAGPVPGDNRPGHHPPVEQDKPVERYRRKVQETAASAHQAQLQTEELSLEVDDMVFDGLVAGRQAAPLVVLLHGFPQSAHSWREVIPRLAEAGFRIWAPNQRGYSLRARPTEVSAYRLDHLVADVVRMAEKLGHHRFHLVGHDWGGAVGWAAAAAHPDRILSLTSVSTPHPRAFAASMLRSDQLLRSGYMGLFAAPALPEFLFRFGAGKVLQRLLTRSGLPAETAQRYVAALAGDGGLSGALNWYRAARPGVMPRGGIQVPTLYVWGDQDVALGPVAAAATARYVAGPYRFEKLSGISHWIPETAPGQLADLVIAHLDRVGSGSAQRAAS